MTGRQLNLLPNADPEPTGRGDQWATPPTLFQALNAEFGPFVLDAAALPGNALCARRWTPADDGLAQRWGPGPTWCNPPYSQPGPWCAKAVTEARAGVLAVLLLPVSTGAAWFRDHVADVAEVRFLAGRVRFVGAPGPARFDSLVAIYHPGLALPPKPWICWDWKAAIGAAPARGGRA